MSVIWFIHFSAEIEWNLWQCLVWLRICPSDESTVRWQNLAHTTFAVTLLTGLICMMAACLTFCWRFVSIDFERSVFSFMVAVAEFTVIYMALVGILLLRHKIRTIFDSLATIYKDRMCVFLEIKI